MVISLEISLFGLFCPIEYRSCDEARADGNTKDGHYIMRLNDRCRDPIRVYCVAMDTENPSAYITLEAGAENNFAVIHDKRLRDRFQCDGPTMSQTYGESGTTTFNKVKLDLRTLRLIDDDFRFSETTWQQENTIRYCR